MCSWTRWCFLLTHSCLPYCKCSQQLQLGDKMQLLLQCRPVHLSHTWSVYVHRDIWNVKENEGTVTKYVPCSFVFVHYFCRDWCVELNKWLTLGLLVPVPSQKECAARMPGHHTGELNSKLLPSHMHMMHMYTDYTACVGPYFSLKVVYHISSIRHHGYYYLFCSDLPIVRLLFKCDDYSRWRCIRRNTICPQFRFSPDLCFLNRQQETTFLNSLGLSPLPEFNVSPLWLPTVKYISV